jgi:hypothetical protein
LILATAALLNAGEQMPCMHLRLSYDDVGSHSTEPTWRSALGVLLDARHSRERVHLLVETSAFAVAAGEIWQRPIAVLPHPSPLVATPADPAANGFTLYVPGEKRADKGAHLLTAVVQALSRRLDAAHGPLRILAHDQASAGGAAVEIESLAAFSPAEEYASNWRRAHAALLLHDPRVYRLRGSGVTCDAVAAGRPYICLNGSSLVEGASLVAEPNADAIADAVVLLMLDYGKHAQRSALAAARFPDRVRAGLAEVMELVQPQ